jgi:hypothetical protein
VGRILTNKYKKKESVLNETGRQIEERTGRRLTKPVLTEVVEPQGYIQNAEQNDTSIWNRIKK